MVMWGVHSMNALLKLWLLIIPLLNNECHIIEPEAVCMNSQVPQWQLPGSTSDKLYDVLTCIDSHDSRPHT